MHNPISTTTTFFIHNPMSTITTKEKIAFLNGRLALYLDAEEAILSGQSYRIEGLELTRANLADVQSMIRSLYNQIEELEARLTRSRRYSRVIRPAW